MRRMFLLAVSLGCLLCQEAFCQTSSGYTWWNPAKSPFPVIEGQGWHSNLAGTYDRLPAKAEKTVRKVVWYLSRQGAGLMIRFRSNATGIRVRYTVGGKLAMPHMAATGVSGLDLFALDKDGAWEWCHGKYHFGDTIEYKYAFNALKHDYVREYHLYLPLYNNVKWLEIGVPDSMKITPLPLSPDKPVVVYGTSIAQGACASRPGMAWTALLGRRLHRPVINLGFSGNGQLEEAVVNLLTELDPQIYVIDCLPNMTGFPDDTIEARMIRTVRTLREKKPHVPILITEDADANIITLDTTRDNADKRVNAAGESAFAKLKSSGVEDIYFLPASTIGFDLESTVEGTHPNDYGMELYASAYEKAIRSILHEPVGKYTTTRPCIQYRSKVYDWEGRHLRELQMNKTNPPPIVFLGNSITHYWGGDPYCRIHRGEDSWDKYFKPLGVRNFGFSFDRIENVLWRVYHGELDGYKAKQVVLNIGTNNLGYNSDEQILAGLKLLIEAIKERQPAAKVLVLGIYPRKGGEERVAALNRQIIGLCGNENVNFANPGTGLLDKSGEIDTSLFVDGRLHPNAAGYRLLAKAIRPYLVSR